MWQLSLGNILENPELFELALADDAVSSAINIHEDTNSFSVELIYSQQPDIDILRQVIRHLCVIAGIDGVDVTLTKLESKDWISETIRSFPPIDSGRFFIFGSHYEGKIPHGKIPVLMDAGTAFGSGEHATTAACLEAITYLAKRHKFERVLDVGTGSGILSIAASKIMSPKIVTGVDIDDTAVKFAHLYAAKNQLRNRYVFAVSNGYKNRIVKAAAHGQKYDIIIANILARPLMKMAKDLAAHLKPDGYAILSGLLERQEQMALYPHQLQGLKLHKRITKNGWIALIIKRA